MEENKPSPYAVEIPADAMRWKIHAKRLPDICGDVDGVPWVDEEASFELSWGWTANMTDEEVAKLADDCPKGKGSVITGLSLLKELRDELNVLIEEAEKNPPVKSAEQIAMEEDLNKKMAELMDSFRQKEQG